MKFLKNFGADLSASVVVFLVALPLCLGIALGSGAPLFSGIIGGIVGGIVIGALSGSQLSVSGPAAGLTVWAVYLDHGDAGPSQEPPRYCRIRNVESKPRDESSR